MNDTDKKIVDEMITYVENKERDIQASKIGKSGKSKAVNEIIKELERCIKNAN